MKLWQFNFTTIREKGKDFWYPNHFAVTSHSSALNLISHSWVCFFVVNINHVVYCTVSILFLYTSYNLP